MHLCTCNHWLMILSRGMNNLSFAFHIFPSQGWPARRLPLPNISDVTSTVIFLPWDLLFTRCVVQNFRYLFSLAYKPCPFEKILRAPLLSWGFHFIVVWWNWWRFLLNIVWRIYTDLTGVLYIVYRFLCISGRYCLEAVLWNYSWSLGYLMKGDPICLRDWFTMASNVLGNLLPNFWSLCTLMQKVSWGYFPFSLTGFFFVVVFHLIL